MAKLSAQEIKELLSPASLEADRYKEFSPKGLEFLGKRLNGRGAAVESSRTIIAHYVAGDFNNLSKEEKDKFAKAYLKQPSITDTALVILLLGRGPQYNKQTGQVSARGTPIDNTLQKELEKIADIVCEGATYWVRSDSPPPKVAEKPLNIPQNIPQALPPSKARGIKKSHQRSAA